MKIKACPDCGKEKSPDALWCVHCGSIKFGRQVTFMVSWALASIPAALVFAIIVTGFVAIFGGMLRH